MKTRTRRFAGGGDDGLEDFENKALPTARKYARDPEDLEDFEDKAIRRRPKVDVEDFEDKVLPTGGRFAQTDPDIYERATKAVAQRAAKADVATAKPKPAPAAPPAPVSSPSIGVRSTGRGGPTADELSEYQRQQRLMTPGADALEGVYPEQLLGPGSLGVGARAVAGAAKTLAKYPLKTLGTAGKEGLEAMMAYGPKAGMEVAESTARGAASRAAVQAKRAERSSKATARKQKKFDDMMEARKQQRIAEINAREPSMASNYSKGGKAFAKGGSVSSASSRGDGIAQRGKTRGTMVACGGGYMRGKK